MTARNTSNTSELAETIRRRLERAAQTAAAPQTPEPANRLRVTKDGELVAPGEEIPKGPDGKPVAALVVPDATFHKERA